MVRGGSRFVDPQIDAPQLRAVLLQRRIHLHPRLAAVCPLPFDLACP